MLFITFLFLNLIFRNDASQSGDPKSPHLTLNEYNTYVRLTDTSIEYGVSELNPEASQLWNDNVNFQWDVAQRVESLKGKPYPFIICHKSSNGVFFSGNEHRMAILEALNRLTEDGANGRKIKIRNILNHNVMYCAYTRIYYSEAVQLKGFVINPFHATMKLLPGTIEGIEVMVGKINDRNDLSNDDNISNDSINVEVCPGYFDNKLNDVSEMKLIEKITSYISADPNVEPNAMSEFYWTSQAPKYKNYTATKRAKMWIKIFDEGIKSGTCVGIFRNNLSWTFDSAIKSYGGTSILNVKLRYNSRDPKYAICMLALVGALSTMEDICTVEFQEKEKLYNNVAQYLVQSGIKDTRPWFVSGLNGHGQTVALSDTGIDVDNCYFRGLKRKVVKYIPYVDNKDIEYGHGTHCAGTIAGKRSDNGIDEVIGIADGIAPGAKLAFIDCGDSQGKLKIPPTKLLLGTGRENSQNPIARIHSITWGFAGSHYSSKSSQFDEYMYENDDLLIVVAAGNRGEGETRNSTISNPATAKNIISVGAHNNYGTSAKSDQLGPSYISRFSNRGPTTDGRSKPDILAPGEYLLSAGARPDQVGECDSPSSPDAGYRSCGLLSSEGTSTAASVIAGTAALIRQYFEEGWYPTGAKTLADQIQPSGALVKAVLLNGAQYMKGADEGKCEPSTVEPYDVNQNFGRVSLIDSLYIRHKSNIQVKVWDRQSIENKLEHRFEVNIDTSKGCTISSFSVTLVWTEESSFTGCQFCVLNDLDLSVERISNQEIYFPNGLSRKDYINNVERVRINDVGHRETMILRVTASNLVKPAQNYSLVATGCFGGSENKLATDQNLFDQDFTECQHSSVNVALIVVAVLMSILATFVIVGTICRYKKKNDGNR